MSKSVAGSASEVVTATWPARWRIASWPLTCSFRALAFLTSSFMKVASAGCSVISHFRLRSVPGRLRLSRMLTCHPSSIIRTAALTPRKPAPPVIKIRRAAPRSAFRADRGLALDLSPDSARSPVGVIEGPYLKTIAAERPRRVHVTGNEEVSDPSGSRSTHAYHRRVAPSDRALSAPDTRSLRSNWESETRMAGVYDALAEVASDAGLRLRLKSLAATEKRHADAWAELLTAGGVKLPERTPRFTARVLAGLARIAGIGPALALAGAAEGQVLRSYLGQVATVSDQRAQGVLRKLLPEELDHQSSDDIAEGGDSRPVTVGGVAFGVGSDVVDEEWHGGGIESIRNVIYGVNDGLTATLGVLAGVGGASVEPHVVLIGGLSAMVASGVSMAGGAYLASKSQREVFEGQLAREAAEIEAMPELERAELVKIYRSKGLTPAEATTIVGRITADKKVWLQTPGPEELGPDGAPFA